MEGNATNKNLSKSIDFDMQDRGHAPDDEDQSEIESRNSRVNRSGRNTDFKIRNFKTEDLLQLLASSINHNASINQKPRQRHANKFSSLSQPKKKLTQHSSLHRYARPVVHSKINRRKKMIKERTIIRYVNAPEIPQTKIYQNKMKQFEKTIKHRPTLQFRNRRKERIKLKQNNQMKTINSSSSREKYLTPGKKKQQQIKTHKQNSSNYTDPSKSTATGRFPDERMYLENNPDDELRQKLSFGVHQDNQNALFPPIMPFNFNGMNVGF